MKMNLKWSIIVLLLFSMAICYAKNIEPLAWNTFDGKLGKREVQFSLYLFKDGTIKGNYIFKDSSTKIKVIGSAHANAIFLNELNSAGCFKGNYFSDTLDKFEGTWTDSLQNTSLTFYLELTSIAWGDYEHRYTDMYGTTDEIENFMEQVKKAILSDNKEWVVNHMRYPTRQVVDKGFTSINNNTELIRYYDQIFTKAFKDKIRHDATTNLFNKNGAAMLGDGEIWIANTSNSTNDKYDFIIFAIGP